MGTAEVIGIAVGLALDAFAVSLAIGAARLAPAVRPIFRLSFHFGLFQFLMPLCGWMLGAQFADAVAAWDHWLAMGLLSFVGIRMIRSGRNQHATAFAVDPSRGAMLVMLSVATSIDAFAVGITLAMLGIEIWYPSAIIGIITAMMSLCALLVGHRLGRRFGKRMEVLGGVVLIAIGLRLLLSHLL